MQTLNILKENCDPKKDDNAKLPYNAYLVQYKVGDKDEARWDLAMSYKSVEIFDYYYDKYKNVKEIKWTKGIVSPRTYEGLVQSPAPKKKAKRK